MKVILIAVLIAASAFTCSLKAFADLKGHYYTLYRHDKVVLAGSIEDEASDRVKIRIDKVGGNWLAPDCVNFGDMRYCVGDTKWAPKPDASANGYIVEIK